MRSYKITPYNIHIQDSYDIPKRDFDAILDDLTLRYPDCEVWHRSRWSLKVEWAAHTLAYYLGISRKKTGSVDLNYPQKWYVKLVYSLVGNIALLVIK